jgi:hypothetical protein
MNLCFAGIKQEKSLRWTTCQTKNHIPPWPQVKKILENTRRQATKGGAHQAFTQVGRPHPRSADPSGSHLSASFTSRFSTALGFSSSSLIKVSLIRGLWCIPPAYISRTLPPGLEHPQSWVESLSLPYNQETLDRIKSQAFKRRLVL